MAIYTFVIKHPSILFPVANTKYAIRQKNSVNGILGHFVPKTAIVLQFSKCTLPLNEILPTQCARILPCGKHEPTATGPDKRKECPWLQSLQIPGMIWKEESGFRAIANHQAQGKWDRSFSTFSESYPAKSPDQTIVQHRVCICKKVPDFSRTFCAESFDGLSNPFIRLSVC